MPLISPVPAEYTGPAGAAKRQSELYREAGRKTVQGMPLEYYQMLYGAPETPSTQAQAPAPIPTPEPSDEEKARKIIDDMDAGRIIWDDNLRAWANNVLAKATPKSPEQIVNDILASQQEAIEKESKWLEQYTVEHPFAFDEELAKKSATAEYQPYYTELLEDYLAGVDIATQTIESERKYLGEMEKVQTGQLARSYERAVTQASEGFAGSGMFFSGIKKRALGGAEVEYGAEREELATGYGIRGKRLGLREEELGLEERIERKRLGREKEEAIETGVLTRRGEAMRGYYVPFTQAYKRQYPTGTLGVEGYLPESYLMYA